MVLAWPALLVLSLGLLVSANPASDPARSASPPPNTRKAKPVGRVLFEDDFSSGKLTKWATDREGVWSVWRGVLRADLPDEKQQRSFAWFGDSTWADVAVDLDVCQMRGVDKGVVVRANDGGGIGVDLRSGVYQDILMYRRQWPLGKAKATNPNGVWHHLRMELRGPHIKVFVNGELKLEREAPRDSDAQGRMGLPAYTGGVGQCTVYYDNIVVTALD